MLVLRVGLTSFVLFLFMAISGLQAATVNTVTGQVLINRGAGYQKISGTASGNAGDKVLANPNSSATIVYENGCIVEVNPGQVVTIATQPPCLAGATLPQAVTPTQIAVGLGVVGAAVAGAVIILNDNPASP